MADEVVDGVEEVAEDAAEVAQDAVEVVADVTEEVGDALDDAADFIADEALPWMADFTEGFAEGAGGALYDMAKFAKDIQYIPAYLIQNREALWHMATHPDDTAKAMIDEYVQLGEDLISGDPSRMGDAIGQLSAEAAVDAMTGGASKGAKVARRIDDIPTVADDLADASTRPRPSPDVPEASADIDPVVVPEPDDAPTVETGAAATIDRDTADNRTDVQVLPEPAADALDKAATPEFPASPKVQLDNAEPIPDGAPSNSGAAPSGSREVADKALDTLRTTANPEDFRDAIATSRNQAWQLTFDGDIDGARGLVREAFEEIKMRAAEGDFALNNTDDLQQAASDLYHYGYDIGALEGGLRGGVDDLTNGARRHQPPRNANNHPPGHYNEGGSGGHITPGTHPDLTYPEHTRDMLRENLTIRGTPEAQMILDAREQYFRGGLGDQRDAITEINLGRPQTRQELAYADNPNLSSTQIGAHQTHINANSQVATLLSQSADNYVAAVRQNPHNLSNLQENFADAIAQYARAHGVDEQAARQIGDDFSAAATHLLEPGATQNARYNNYFRGLTNAVTGIADQPGNLHLGLGGRTEVTMQPNRGSNLGDNTSIGGHFDGNRSLDGSLTPRSAQIQSANSMLADRGLVPRAMADAANQSPLLTADGRPVSSNQVFFPGG